MDKMTQNQETVLCEVLTNSGHSIEDNSGQSDNKVMVNCEVLRDLERTLKTAVDTVTQDQETVMRELLTDI